MPTRDTPWPDGTPCWIDYGAADPAATKRFYGELLGWRFTEEDPAFGNYVQALLHDRQAAGTGPQQDPSDLPRWTTYLATSDIRAHEERIAGNGGTVVVADMAVGPMGTMAFYTAVFGYRWDEVPDAGGYMPFRSDERPPEHPLDGLGGLTEGAPKGWQTCFAVASTDEAVAIAERGGAHTLAAPEDTPFGRFAVLRDPWGAPFEVMQTQD